MPSRYPSQTHLLQMDWEEWAPLLFLGKERHQVGKEDKEIVKEVGFLTHSQGFRYRLCSD